MFLSFTLQCNVCITRPTDIVISSEPVVQKIRFNPASVCETSSSRSLCENLQVESSRFYRKVLAKFTYLTHANEKKEERLDLHCYVDVAT